MKRFTVDMHWDFARSSEVDADNKEDAEECDYGWHPEAHLPFSEITADNRYDECSNRV